MVLNRITSKQLSIFFSFSLCWMGFTYSMISLQEQPLNAVIILDTIAWQNETGIVTLEAAIKSKVPTIVTSWVISVALKAKNKTVSSLTDGSWLIFINFNQNRGDFTLLIPRDYSSEITQLNDLHKIGINSKDLIAIKPADLNAHFNVPIHKFDSSNLERLFLKNSLVRKSFFVIGHGIYTQELYGKEETRHIANLKLYEYKKLLQLFNELNTDFAYISSCFAGGRNLVDTYEKTMIQGTYALPLNYFLMISSLTDVQASASSERDFKTFFSIINQFFSPAGLTMDNPFLAIFKALKESSLYDIPQVRFPGVTNYFKAITAKDIIEIITYSKMQAHILQAKLPFLSQKEKELLQKISEARAKRQELNPSESALLESYLKEKAKEIKNSVSPFLIDSNKKGILLYPAHLRVPLVFKSTVTSMPALISMIPGHAFHLLDSVNAEHIKLNTMILEGTFNDILATEKVFLFDTLICQNYPSSGFENIALHSTLTLHNVMMRKKPQTQGGIIVASHNNSYYHADINYFPENPQTPILSVFQKISDQEALQEFAQTIRELEVIERALVQASGGQEILADIKSIIEQSFLNGKKIGIKQITPQELVDAILAGNKDTIQKLVKAGTFLDKTRSGKVPLIEAVKKLDIVTIELLLANGANINAQDSESKTALTESIFLKNMPITTLLLEKGANVNIQSLGGDTPLILACKTMNIPMIALLLHNNADPNMQNREGKTALDIAKSMHLIPESSEAVQLLETAKGKGGVFERLERLPRRSLYKSSSQLHMAVALGDDELITFLSKRGTDINALDNNSRTPLDIAIGNDDIPRVKLLLKNGANPEIETHGKNALIAAIKKDNPEITQLLLDMGMSLPITIEGNRLIDYLYFNNIHKIIPILAQAGFDVNQKDQQGNSFLITTMFDKPDFAKALVDAGANININDTQGIPLLITAIFSNPDFARVLIESGADLAVTDENGSTPLLASIFSDNIPLLELLIKKGANVNELTAEHLTPLVAAIESEKPEIVKILLNAGANKDEKNDEDQTPRDIAHEMGNEEIIKLLE